jgi:hypothetical protein
VDANKITGALSLSGGQSMWEALQINIAGWGMLLCLGMEITGWARPFF